MEPENHPFGKEDHLQKPSLLGSMLIFRGYKGKRIVKMT